MTDWKSIGTPSLNFTNVVTKTLRSSRSGLGQSNLRQSLGLSSARFSRAPTVRQIPAFRRMQLSQLAQSGSQYQVEAGRPKTPNSGTNLMVANEVTICVSVPRGHLLSSYLPYTIPLLKSTLLVPNPSPQGFQKDSTQHKPRRQLYVHIMSFISDQERRKG